MLLRRSLLKVGVMGLVLLLASAAAVLSRSPGRAVAASPGPVAEYSFDENPGEATTIEDDSGNEHTATIHGAEWTPHGRYGGAMEFDGAKDDYLSIPASEELDRTGEEFTIEAWVRPTGSPTRAAILTKERSGSGPHYSYELLQHHEEPLGEFMESDEGLVEGDEHAIPPDSWTHIAITDDGAHTRLYVDGELEDTSPAVTVEGDGELRIGGNGIGGEYFTGRIDEVRIYERALSGAEVDADMETPIATPKAGPVAEYSFDELAEGAESVEDHSGHGHTATIHGAKPTVHGRYGGAMEFKEGEYLSVPSSPELNLTEEFTLEAWIHPETSHEFDDILSKETTEAKDPSHAAYLMADHHGQFATYYGEYENAYYSPGEEIPMHTWTHVAVVDDGARIHLFLNGQEVESGPAFPIISTEGGELRIGSSRLIGEDHDFLGRIDEVRIYGRALNATEVGADMETPIQTPKAGPVAAYSFDEGVIGTEGGTVEDVSEHGHTATLEGGAVRAKGRYGDALHFREEGDCATVAPSPELDLSEEFTLEAWVWSEGGLYEDPIVVREAGGKGVFGIGIGSREEGEAEGFVGEGKSSKAAIGGGDIVRENSWVHIATTYDGSKLRLYVDGELVATKSATTPPATGEGSLRIGCDGPDGPFGGRIDEVRLYGRALNGPEVDSDMESPLRTPKRTPVADYSFDEDNNETAADLTNDGHTATVEGAEWTEHGKYGGGMEFKAADEGVLKIPASEELDFDEEFTLEAWVRPSGEDNHDAPLIDKQEGSAHGYFLYEGGTVSDRPYGAANEEQEFIHAENPLPADTWSHVALTFSGNRTYLYVNGELVANGSAEPTVTSEGELEIGGSTDTADYFDGRIDEIRIYNRELDQAEVAADMEAPIQTPKRGPVAAWSFDEGEEGDETVEDTTGDGHTATLHGAKWTPNGKYGGAMEFHSAEDEYLSVPDSPELDLTEALTIEAWVRPDAEHHYDDPIVTKQLGTGGTEGRKKLPYWLYAEGDEGEPTGGTEAAGWVRGTATAPDPLPRDAWSHVALTYDGSTIRLYVNGEQVESEPGPLPQATGGELEIGGAAERGNFMNGRIDDVRIYNRALTAEEVEPDETPPTSPSVIAARYESGVESPDTFVTWFGAVDPKSSTGVTSGVKGYVYRYRLASGSWTSRSMTTDNGFSVEAGPVGSQIAVDIATVDNEGNESPPRHVVLHSVESSLTPENYGEADPKDEFGNPTPLPEPEFHPGDSEEEDAEPKGRHAELAASEDPEKLCPTTLRCGTYNGHLAAEYARRWVFAGENNQYVEEHHNRAFKYFGEAGGDCTNFASQALHAGGMKFLKTEGHNDPHEWPNDEELEPNPAYHRGTGSWWSGYWSDYIGAGEFQRDYKVTEGWDQARTLYRHLIETGLGRELSPGEPLHEGDLLFFDLYRGDNTEHIDHTEIVTGVLPSGAEGKGYVFLSQHSQAKTVTMAEEFKHVRKEYEVRGINWEVYFVRPMYTEGNINEMSLE